MKNLEHVSLAAVHTHYLNNDIINKAIEANCFISNTKNEITILTYG